MVLLQPRKETSLSTAPKHNLRLPLLTQFSSSTAFSFNTLHMASHSEMFSTGFCCGLDLNGHPKVALVLMAEAHITDIEGGVSSRGEVS